MLKRTACLKQIYPSLRSFFRGVLWIADSNLTILLQEALMVCLVDSLDFMLDLFAAISNRLLQGPGTDDLDLLQTLARARIFPIRERGHSCIEAKGFDNLRTATDKDMWLVADRPHLQQCFEGRVGLLAFDSKQIDCILPLLRSLPSGASALIKDGAGSARNRRARKPQRALHRFAEV